MLLADKGLYTIQDLQTGHNIIRANISLNASHEIFKGHFPQQPVLPGVCMLQISQELLEKVTEKRLLMYHTGQIKFLHPVKPDITSNILINIQFTEALENVNVQWINKEQQAVLKYTASFREV